MTISEQYQAYNIALADSNVFTQVSDPQPSAGMQELVEYGIGAVEPGFLAVGDITPELSWSTNDLATWGSVFTSAYGSDNETKHVIAPQSGASVIRYQKTRSGSTRYGTGTSNHIVTTIRDSVVTWSSVSADQGGTASARLNLSAVYDGTNAPISLATSTTISGGTTPTGLWTLGPVKRNGTFETGIMSCECATNVGLERLLSDGLEYPTFAYVSRVAHVITVMTPTISLQSTAGYKSAVTALLVYFRRRTANGQNYADASTQHVKLTYQNGMMIVPRVEGSMAKVPVRYIMKESPVIATGVAIA